MTEIINIFNTKAADPELAITGDSVTILYLLSFFVGNQQVRLDENGENHENGEIEWGALHKTQKKGCMEGREITKKTGRTKNCITCQIIYMGFNNHQ
ncbi:hypothetical protein CEXT_226951 [Caerostris extrusa]|uniref:Uncharacterized protein n=1 Tax=Caerostris extrusa TaxID=172846 RepID=A0AAV4NLF2_CAEEX|nr:hypothetical protein CEXT_226951 [Caerostris extrusa]